MTTASLERAREILRRAPVIDGHNDVLWQARDQVGYDFERLDLAGSCPDLMTDIPRIREGGLGGQFWSVYVPSDLPGDTAVTATLEQIDALRAMLARYPDTLSAARTAEDVDRAAAEGRVASMVGVEGGHAIEVSEAPVIFSHSSARALCDVSRNVPDGVIGKLASNGGVLMVTFVPVFLTPAGAEANAAGWAEFRRLKAEHPDDREAVEARMDAWFEGHPAPPTSVADVADHVDHVREIAGIDHIGVGSDFDGAPSMPDGLEDVSCYPNLFAELVERGYSDQDLAGISCDNVLRVMREAEAVAERLRAERPPSLARIGDLDG